MDIFGMLKTTQELEARAYKRGFQDGLKQKKMILKDIGKSAKVAYKYRYEPDEVGNSCYHIMCVIDEITDFDFAGRKKFEQDRAKFLEKQAKK